MHATVLAQFPALDTLINNAGVEAGKAEIRPGASNMLKAMSRIALQFMLTQMAKMAKPRTR